jgi:transcriptional regulator with PAS, ATPase and Fis domain
MEDNHKEQNEWFELFEEVWPKETTVHEDTLPFELAYIEKRRIRLALDSAINHTQAAKQLGIGRTNLLAKIKKYGISKSN